LVSITSIGTRRQRERVAARLCARHQFIDRFAQGPLDRLAREVDEGVGVAFQKIAGLDAPEGGLRIEAGGGHVAERRHQPVDHRAQLLVDVAAGIADEFGQHLARERGRLAAGVFGNFVGGVGHVLVHPVARRGDTTLLHIISEWQYFSPKFGGFRALHTKATAKATALFHSRHVLRESLACDDANARDFVSLT